MFSPFGQGKLKSVSAKTHEELVNILNEEMKNGSASSPPVFANNEWVCFLYSYPSYTPKKEDFKEAKTVEAPKKYRKQF